MDTNKILSIPVVKFAIAMGVGLALLFSIKLLPSEAHDLKSFQIECEVGHNQETSRLCAQKETALHKIS